MMLKNKVAIVTGGTRGIGFAVVKKFIENGAAVSLWGSRQETVERVISRCEDKWKISKFERYSTGNSDDKSGKRRIWSC